MSEITRLYHIYKSPMQDYCMYAPADTPMWPSGKFELLVVEATQSQIEVIQKAELEGHITFDDIKAQYTNPS